MTDTPTGSIDMSKVGFGTASDKGRRDEGERETVVRLRLASESGRMIMFCWHKLGYISEHAMYFL
jgi:hypothetical protein